MLASNKWIYQLTSILLSKFWSNFFWWHLQKRAIEAEQEVEKAYKQIDKLKKKLEKEATRPAYDDETSKAKYDIDETLDQGWREEFEPFYNGDDGELPKLSEPSWFSGYDRCNI